MSSLRDAYRSLVGAPWSTAAMVLTLGIGIGASTAVYAVFNHALLRPVPGVASTDRLVRVEVEASIDRPGLQDLTTVSMPYRHLVAARAMPAFQGLASFLEPPPAPVLLMEGADAELADVTIVTRGYFEVLGVRAAAGRLFGPEEYETSGMLLAVISERLWRARFAANPSALGHTIHIGGRRFTAVGVTRDFRGLSRVGREDIWVPWGAGILTGALTGSEPTSAGTMIGQLAPGISLEQATSQVAAAFSQAGPIRSGVEGATPRVVAELPGPSPSAVAGLRTTLWTGLAAAFLLLGLACANAAAYKRRPANRSRVVLEPSSHDRLHETREAGEGERGHPLMFAAANVLRQCTSPVSSRAP